MYNYIPHYDYKHIPSDVSYILETSEIIPRDKANIGKYIEMRRENGDTIEIFSQTPEITVYRIFKTNKKATTK